jgi:formate dehydrogenase
VNAQRRPQKLHVNPVDASAAGISSGDEVSLTTEVGTVHVLVEVTDKISVGTVSYPHGSGHEGGWHKANQVLSRTSTRFSTPTWP